jgi:pimeloyl-ACP methyl ester carboxylesterase
MSSAVVALIGTVVLALAATAGWVAYEARQAVRRHPPIGGFVEVDGVRLHYVDRGHGTPLVLIHGNAVHLEDFTVGGLLDRLAQRYRVVAFDRPGCGHSERPRDRAWTAAEQANVIEKAVAELGIEQPIVLGHSWGTLVALELALRKTARVRKVVLVSGYYYPQPRLDVALVAPAAIPVVGDILRYTVSALLARALLRRSVAKMFAPRSVPRDFYARLGREMLVRPPQIRANAEDAAYLVPSAAALAKRYRELDVPLVILAGADDTVVDPDRHARKLHDEVGYSSLHVFPRTGHMVHHAAAKELTAAVGLSGAEMLAQLAKAVPDQIEQAD